MKNTSSGSEESFFKKKGFFIALYSTLGAVMVLALVITFTNLTATPGNNELAALPPESAEREDTQSVDSSDVESYEVQRAEQEESDETAWWRAKPSATPSTAPSATPAPTVPPAATPAPVSPPTSETPAAPTVPVPANPTSPAEPAAEGETPAETGTAESETPAEADTAAVESTETQTAAFTPFNETDKMLWPVTGEIAMDFSVDKLVYDPTLDQYRTNDDIRITAKEGTPVKACAEGQVLEVGNNHVYGNYVAIDHGNGFVTTYGQLMEGVLVDAGEVVDAGQVIGGVGKPSYFGSLNGSHMNLRLTKADEPLDPKSFLAAAE